MEPTTGHKTLEICELLLTPLNAGVWVRLWLVWAPASCLHTVALTAATTLGLLPLLVK